MPITNTPILTEANKKWINENSHLYTIAEMEFKIKQDGNNQVTNKVLGSYVRYYKLPYKRDMNYKKSERRKSLPISDEFFNIDNYKNMIV